MPSPRDLLENLTDGRAKLHVIRKGLEVRRRLPALFHGGRYEPLYADGGREENLCAFALRSGSQLAVAMAPRLFARLMQPGEVAPLGERFWGDAAIKLEMEGRLVDVLTGESHAGGELRIARVLADFPVALLVRETSG
jgi:(1->4)-alpha-D-glucan 1-alpha-D-glucosylmutase